jgi:hypothetical protein
MAKQKQAFLECTFPELKGGDAHGTGKGRGSNARLAIARAFADMLRFKKGARFTTITARIVVTSIDAIAVNAEVSNG